MWLASTALTLISALAAVGTPAAAQDATWLASPGSGDLNTGTNWSTATVPTGTAFFGASGTTALTVSNGTIMDGWTFNAGASAYTVAIGSGVPTMEFVGAGIVVNGGSVAITNDNAMYFSNASTAGTATITNRNTLNFAHTSTAGSATITTTTNNGMVNFYDTSTAGNATITLNGGGGTYVIFNNSSTAGSATIRNWGGSVHFADNSTAGTASIDNQNYMTFNNTATAGSASITSRSSLIFRDNSTAGNATITLTNAGGGGYTNFDGASTAGSATITVNSGHRLIFNNTSTAGSAAITNNSGATLIFNNTSTAGSAAITNNGGATLTFNNASTAGSATITNNAGGRVTFNNTSTAGSAGITSYSLVEFLNGSTAGSAGFTSNGAMEFRDTSTAGSATITNNNALSFFNTSTAGSATITTNAGVTTAFVDSSTGGNARFITNAGATFDMSGLTSSGMTAGSIAGAGDHVLGAKALTVGSNNLSTEVSGVISGTGGSLIKTGTGTLTLSGTNTYTGATTVNGGTLAVNSSLTATSGITVNSGGTLGGNGVVGNTTINGGTLAPGNSIGLLTVQGNLVLTAASRYMVEVSPANADRVNVTGAANLGGATVNASFAQGSYINKRYTIVNATGGLGGTTFSALVNSNLPSSVTTSLSYDTNNAYLDLELSFVRPAAGAGGNQQGVGNALVDYFNRNGGIPLVYSGLTQAGLTQASGETATGGQQTAFNAMTQFMGSMTDTFAAGRSDGAPGAMGFADDSSASAAAPAAKSHAARDAYAMFTKAPLASSYDPRWSIWASGFGGSQTTDGNGAAGSNTSSSRIYGVAAGADYRLSPDTIAGFAMAGGGTNFSVTGGGSGHSDLFQIGGFVRHAIGATYLSGALAYGWQDVTTNRTVIADQLQARFNANTFSGRFEAGHRVATSWLGGLGLTPYAAAQVTAIALPAYAETVLSGSNAFALSYAGKTVTDTRSELGLRTDKSFALDGAMLTLRGRAAWAHDFNTDRAASATFLALPGASFVVNGAAAAHDAALTTASAEVSFLNGISLAATFEGEFSDVTRSYAGKGTVRYAW